MYSFNVTVRNIILVSITVQLVMTLIKHNRVKGRERQEVAETKKTIEQVIEQDRLWYLTDNSSCLWTVIVRSMCCNKYQWKCFFVSTYWVNFVIDWPMTLFIIRVTDFEYKIYKLHTISVTGQQFLLWLF